MTKPLRKPWVLAAAVVGLIGVPVVATTPIGAASAATAKPAKAAYPKIKVNDLANGKMFDLSELAKTDTTTLVWFWAPL